MKKNELKDFWVIELRFKHKTDIGLYLQGAIHTDYTYYDISCFNDDLQSDFYNCEVIKVSHFEVTRVLIQKIILGYFDCEKECYSLISDIINNSNLTTIWERKKEIDWSKVPRWTKVKCKGECGSYNAYHYNYTPTKIYCFEHTTRDEFTFDTDPIVDYLSERDTYEIHPSIKIKEEWLKK